MVANKRETLVKASVIAAFAVMSLGAFAEGCGNLHAGDCGVLTIPAVLLLLPAMYLKDAIPGIDSEPVFWALFALTMLIWVWPVAYLVLRWALRRSR
jgi:hypothetical protein